MGEESKDNITVAVRPIDVKYEDYIKDYDDEYVKDNKVEFYDNKSHYYTFGNNIKAEYILLYDNHEKVGKNKAIYFLLAKIEDKKEPENSELGEDGNIINANGNGSSVWIFKLSECYLLKNEEGYLKKSDLKYFRQSNGLDYSLETIISSRDPNLQIKESELDAFLRKYGVKKDKEAEETYISEEEICKSLQKQRQIILYGPPGTGKTRMAKMIAKKLIDAKDLDKEQIKLVQFHPAYSYEDFVEGIEMKEDGTFSPEEKMFRKIAKTAKNDRDNKYVLIIDEINRAKISSVFGELLYGMEYRNIEIDMGIMPDNPLMIPDNLYIIGTMNTADRSLSSMDYALRRRFAFIPVYALPKYIKCDKLKEEGKKFWCSIFKKVKNDIENNTILGIDYKDICPGMSYFISKDTKEMQYKIQFELFPLLEEYARNGMLKKTVPGDDKESGKPLYEKILSREYIKELLDLSKKEGKE